jgi:hypothetical protein
MFMFFDPMYLLFLLPGIALAIWAQWRVSSAFAKGSQIRPRSGRTGAHAAYEVLQAAGVDGVGIERVDGHLSDHYDPRHKVLRLSPEVYSGQSLAALGVAAHEAGHAIQDAQRYPLLIMRSVLVPVATFGSQASWLILAAGIGLAIFGNFFLAKWFIYIGIAAFSAVVAFQLVNLPVEFDASRRARVALQDTGLVTVEEDRIVGKVLNAAALTYVAATLTAMLTLAYYIFRYGGLASRDD